MRTLCQQFIDDFYSEPIIWKNFITSYFTSGSLWQFLRALVNKAQQSCPSWKTCAHTCCKKLNFSQRPSSMVFSHCLMPQCVFAIRLPQQQAEVNCFWLLITVQIELGVSSKLPITRLGKYLVAARETSDRSPPWSSRKIVNQSFGVLFY